MSIPEHAQRWRRTRRFARTLSWVFVVIAVATIINVIGIRVFGTVHGWDDWLKGHSVHFLVWRLCLYGATAYGWWWMRCRVLLREGAAGARPRLRRTEAAAIVAIVALEGAVLAQSL